MTFWGLVLEPHKKYSQTAEEAFHVSMASIDLPSSDQQEEFTAVCVRRDDRDFIVCNLSRKHKILNVPLNLDFDSGDTIDFLVNGNSTVHLTGYVVHDDYDFDEDEGEEESDGEQNDVLLKKTKKLLDAATMKKRKAVPGAQNANKKMKVDPEEEDSEDDSDFDMDSDSADVEEEEDDDEEDDSDVEEEEVEEEEVEKKEPKGKKAKQDKQVAKQQPQQKVKPEKKKPNAQGQKAVNGQSPTQSPNQPEGPAKRVIGGGIQVEELRVGNGPVAKTGKTVSVYYVGRLKNNNKQFDQSTSGPGFKFRLGRGEVIKGWDLGVAGMKVGGKRRLTIPPKMAYGDRGAPPSIPPKSALVFEVELRNVN